MSSAHFLFAATIFVTLAITWRAARRTDGSAAFFAAGHSLGAGQNGLAIAGDFMSAATFLGITGILYDFGFDAFIYIASPLAGLALMLALFAEPFRRLGRFTLADVLATRIEARAARAFAAASTLAVSLFYLVAQIVGAGSLIGLLFGLDYAIAIAIVGLLMALYVAFGGMLATSWVQIVKAVLLMAGVAVLSGLVLARSGFALGGLYDAAAAAHPLGRDIFAAGTMIASPFEAFSLASGLVFGMAGLPHLLIRFYTVRDFGAARRSVLIAMMVIAAVFLLLFLIVGYGAILHLPGEDRAFANGQLIGGGNMAALHLARALGGETFFGLIAAVAFATILAVVAGLTLAAAGTVAHDLYDGLWRKGRASERAVLSVSRLAAFGVGIVAVLLGLLFEGQNIAYMVALAFTVSASANFPILLLALYWPGLTTRGAMAGGVTGLLLSLAMVMLGPAVMVDALGFDRAPFPLRNPALIGMTASFAVALLTSCRERARHRRAAR